MRSSAKILLVSLAFATLLGGTWLSSSPAVLGDDLAGYKILTDRFEDRTPVVPSVPDLTSQGSDCCDCACNIDTCTWVKPGWTCMTWSSGCGAGACGAKSPW